MNRFAVAMSMGMLLTAGCSTITQDNTQSLALTASYQDKQAEKLAEKQAAARKSGSGSHATALADRESKATNN